MFYYNNVAQPFPTAEDAACGAGTFFANMGGNYLLGGCPSLAAVGYFSDIGITVGAQFYNVYTQSPISDNGYFLYTPTVYLDMPAYLDPTNTEYTIPDDWYMVILENGIITDLIQYNTLSCP